MEGIVHTNDLPDHQSTDHPLSPSQEFSAITSRWASARPGQPPISNSSREISLLTSSTTQIESGHPASQEHFHPSRLDLMQTRTYPDSYIPSDVELKPLLVTGANRQPVGDSWVPVPDHYHSVGETLSRRERPRRRVARRDNRSPSPSKSLSRGRNGRRISKYDYDADRSRRRQPPTEPRADRPVPRGPAKDRRNRNPAQRGSPVPHLSQFDHLLTTPNNTKNRVHKRSPKTKTPRFDHPPIKFLNGDQWITEEIINTTTLVNSKAAQTIAPYYLAYHQRRLKGLQFTNEELEMKGFNVNKKDRKSHNARFFERQYTAKILETLQVERYTIVAAGKLDELDAIKQKMHEAEIDFNYALYFPLNQTYRRLFTHPKRNRTAYKPGVGLELPAGVQRAVPAHPAMLQLAERCMEEGTLEDLRFGRIQTSIPVAETGSMDTGTKIDLAMRPSDQVKKWQVAEPADLDVENTHGKIMGDSDDADDIMDSDGVTDSDEDGGVSLIPHAAHF